MTKKELRQYIKEKRKLLSEDEAAELGSKISICISECKLYKEASIILAYWPLPGEADITQIIFDAKKHGKILAFPRLMNNSMDFYKTQRFADLKYGYMNLREPDERCKKVSLVELREALMIMPGVAFDTSLNRCGYGGGYYDRYLEKHPYIRKIAAAYEFQVFDEIPHEDTDIKPEMLFTEKRIITQL